MARKALRLKRIIPFDQLPERQRQLFQSLRDRQPDLFEGNTPPPSEREQDLFLNDSSPWGAGDTEMNPSISDQILHDSSQEFQDDNYDESSSYVNPQNTPVTEHSSPMEEQENFSNSPSIQTPQLTAG